MKLCVTGRETTLEELLRRVRSLGSPLHEARLDFLSEPLDLVIEKLRPCADRLLTTLRPGSQMGAFDDDPLKRAQVLHRLVAELRPAFVDMELDLFEAGLVPAILDLSLETWDRIRGDPRGAERLLEYVPRPRVVVSVHLRAEAIGSLPHYVERLARWPGWVAKVAVEVGNTEDILAVREHARALPHPEKALLPMGVAGFAGRARPSLAGSDWTFVAATAVRVTAPGQLSLSRAKTLRVEESPGLKPVFLAGGHQVLASPGPLVYNRLFRQRNLPLQYLAAPLERARSIAELARASGAKEFSVTMPFKREAGRLFPVAVRDRFCWYAVNTLCLDRRGVNFCANTDAWAAVQILRRCAREGLTTLLVLGSGGAAAAWAQAGARAGLEVLVACRRPEAAKASLGSMARICAWQDRYGAAHDILVNCTPLGADGKTSPWERDLSVRMVVDLVHTSGGTTPLCEAAARSGARVVDGRTFWCLQGAVQTSLFLGERVRAGELAVFLPDHGDTLKHVDEWETLGQGSKAVVLVGMRGAGKSTLGRALALRSGRRFVDTDTEVERVMGASIASLFAEGRQSDFREVEERVVCKAVQLRNAVVAMGGGAVESAEVTKALRNRLCVWLDAPLDVLAARVEDSSRPSVLGRDLIEELEELMRRRRPLYQKCASIIVDTGRTRIEEVADVVELFRRVLQDRDLW